MGRPCNKQYAPVIVDVTPEMASRMLAKNNHNRGLTAARVERMAGDMLRGEWTFNGESIKQDIDDNLLDGQHRLAAIVKSGLTQRMLIVPGLPPEAQDTIDTGTARSVSNVLAIRGESNANTLAAATRMVYAYDIIAIPHPLALSGEHRPTVPQVLKTLEARPAIRESVAFATRHRATLMTVSAVAALHYIFTHVDDEAASDFFVGLADGPWDRGSATYALRERFIEGLKNPAALTDMMRTSLTIRAFNRWRKGVYVDRLQLSRNSGTLNANYPKIDGIDWRRD